MQDYIGTVHVVPVDDVKEHKTDGSICWCGADDDGEVVVYNAADGREQYESVH